MYSYVFLTLAFLTTQACKYKLNDDVYYDFDSIDKDNSIPLPQATIILNFCHPLLFSCPPPTLPPQKDNTIKQENTTQTQQPTQEGTTNSTTQVPVPDDKQSSAPAETTATTPESETTNTAPVDQQKTDTTEESQGASTRLLQQSTAYVILQGKNQSSCDVLVNQSLDQYKLLHAKPNQGLVVQNSNITITLLCSPGLKEPNITEFTPNSSLTIVSSAGMNQIIFIQCQACPILVESKVWEFFGDVKIPLAIILGLFGIAELTLGFRFLRPTLFLVGFLLTFSYLTMIFGDIVIVPSAKYSVVITLIVVSFVFSLLAGYVGMSKPQLGLICIGFGLGSVIAVLLNNLVLYRIEMDFQSLPLIIAILVLGLVFGVLTWLFLMQMVILSTSFLGSYCVIRPLGWFLGGFPNEIQLNKRIKYGFDTDLTWRFYVYLSSIVLLAMIGVGIQYWQYRKRRIMDQLFDYKDMMYYEMGDVTLKLQEGGRSSTSQFKEQFALPQPSQQQQGQGFLKHIEKEERKSNITYSSGEGSRKSGKE